MATTPHSGEAHDPLSLKPLTELLPFETKRENTKYINHVFGGLILVGLMGTTACIYKMMRAQQLRNNLDCLYWQRMRVAGQGFTISVMTVPLLLPHLTTADFLLRRTALPS